MKKTVISIVLILASLFAFSAAEAACWTHFNGWERRVTNCTQGPGWYRPGYWGPRYWGPRYWGPRVWVRPAPGVVVRFGGPYWRGRWWY